MNWDRIEGNWMMYKGKLREKWGRLSDQDLQVIRGKREQLEGKLQQLYGRTKSQASQEVDDFCSSLDKQDQEETR
ncbi:MAG TPA: CsbD family protein [Phycisphaerales bacterium]